jgi:hypothetical protein
MDWLYDQGRKDSSVLPEIVHIVTTIPISAVTKSTAEMGMVLSLMALLAFAGSPTGSRCFYAR